MIEKMQSDSKEINLSLCNFVYQKSFVDVRRERAKSKLFRKATKNSLSLFIRGGDLISIDPQVIGAHEPAITSLINYFSDIGYNGFLIDIGANIGLTSCQNGNKFKQVHMFEPNPYCCKILEVNSVIALNNTTYQIYNYGLGEENKKSVLTVPRNNWGGAFIRDDNSYSDKILASKDNFKDILDSNYYTVDIEVRKTTDALSNVFNELLKNNLMQGVIKIDVEGYEPAVLKGIAESFPSQLKAIVLFESWNSSFDMDAILKSFNGRATAYKFFRETPWKKHWPRLLKMLTSYFRSKIAYRVMINKTQDWRGDLILQVDSAIASTV